MKEMTLKEFVKIKTKRSGQFTGLSLTETKTLPEGWTVIGDGGYNGEYGDFGYVDCWASADHKIIIFWRYGCGPCGEDEWSDIKVIVAS